MKLVSLELDIMFLEIVLERNNGDLVTFRVFTMFVVMIICLIAHLIGLL